MKPFVLFLCFGTLTALPQLPVVTEGTALFDSPNESILQITVSDRAIIDWSQFSIDLDEHTQFIQPSLSSSVLNRVTSSNPSSLLGRLSSNGQVLLINPNGILVGCNAVINTASFIASTLDLQNSVYLSRGEMTFVGSGGVIENQGAMTASGDVIFMGQNLSHSGSIQAKNVTLIAADEVITSSGIEGIYIRSTLARNEGNPFSSAFVQGRITASGGSVRILGRDVKMTTAFIDVSAPLGGGHIYVGGSYQGKDLNLPASLSTFVDRETLLSASSSQGDGGQVVIWSDGSTEFMGQIEAVGVNGGSVEVSGLKGLTYKGYTNLRPHGSNGIFGTLLLDPSDILIDNAASSPAFVPPTYDPVVVMATLDITDLNTALGSASILVQTNAGVGGNGDIILADTALTGIDWSADTKLTLRAQRNLTINNNIIANTAYTGVGDQIELIADSANTGTGDLTVYQLSSNIQVSTVDGPISMAGANIDMGNPAVTSTVTIDAAGSRGFMTMNTPGLLRLQSPGAGFFGVALLSSSQNQTLNAGNWTVLGPGTVGFGVSTLWSSLGTVTAVITGNTRIEAVEAAAAPNSVVVDLGALNLTTNNLSILGGVNSNTNATITTMGAQNITVSNLLLMRAGVGNTSHARLNSGSTQAVRALNIQMFGGTSMMAPNGNSEITSNGNQLVNVGGNILMTPGDGNTTDCLITAHSGDQIVSAGSLTMFGGTSTFGNCRSTIYCELGNQIVSTGLLSMTGGTTVGQNGAGCLILADVGTQTVNATAINMTAGDQINTATEIRAVNTQTINCATDINLIGFISPEYSQIVTNGVQTVNAINITMDGFTNLESSALQTINVANNFTMIGNPFLVTTGRVDTNLNQQIANIGNNLTMTGNSPGSFVSWACGDNSILNIGGDWTEIGAGGVANYSGGSNLLIDVAGNYILDSTTGGDASFSCNDNLNMTIAGSLSIGSATCQGSQSINVSNNVTGDCTIRVADQLSILGGSAASANAFIDVREGFHIAVGTDILVQGGSGSGSFAAITQQFIPNPNVRLLIAQNDITVRGGSGDTSYGYLLNYSNLQLRAGRDFTVAGGDGPNAEAFVFGLATSSIPLSIDLQAGRNISISGGASASGGSFGYAQVLNGSLSLSAARNIVLLGGPLAANNHALLGTAWVDLSLFVMPTPNDVTQMTIQAAGNFLAQNGSLGSIAYIDQVAAGIVEPTFFRSLFPPLVLANNGSLTIHTAGDISLGSGFNASEAPAPFNTLIHNINIISDAPLAAGALWSGTSDPFLSGTPLISPSPAVSANVLGGFKVETGSVGGGIALTSVAGAIHLSSAEFFTNGSLDNLIIGPISTLNNLTLNSISGNITVDPFHNISITNPVTTGGSVFMIAQNDISMTATGLITAGGSIELVCDNQAPVAPLIGPGAFLMEAGATITAGGPLRIFTARQSQNSILGLLNALPFVAGAPYTDTNQERWCVYYPDPILGTPFTIFYKDCLGAILSEQVGPIISQFLVSLHPYDEFLPGWTPRFSLSDHNEDPFTTEWYFLRRRQLKVVNHPKTILGL